MAEDTFQRIIAIEGEIRLELAKERQRVDDWLEGIKAELQGEYRRQLKELKKDVQRHASAREERILDETRWLVQRTRNQIQSLEAIDDAKLKSILKKHLKGIIPRD